MPATPRIFCFINGGKGTDWVRAMAIAEDGTCLARHISSSNEFAVLDSGFAEAPESSIAPMGWGPNLAKRAAFEAHYPEGFDLEWVDDPLTHTGLLAAYRLNQAKAADSEPVVASTGQEG